MCSSVLLLVVLAGVASPVRGQIDSLACYGPGDLAGAVIGTFLATLALVALVVQLYRRVWMKHREKHLVLETDPEKGDYAFDNPGFREAGLSPSSKTSTKGTSKTPQNTNLTGILSRDDKNNSGHRESEKTSVFTENVEYDVSSVERGVDLPQQTSGLSHMPPQAQENRFSKFGVRVLPNLSPKITENDNNVNLEKQKDTQKEDAQTKIQEKKSKVINVKLEKTCADGGMQPSRATELTASAEVPSSTDDVLECDGSIPVVKKREKREKAMENDEDFPVKLMERDNELLGSGIRRDRNNIPEELPDYMANAAMHARKHRLQEADINEKRVKNERIQDSISVDDPIVERIEGNIQKDSSSEFQIFQENLIRVPEKPKKIGSRTVKSLENAEHLGENTKSPGKNKKTAPGFGKSEENVEEVQATQENKEQNVNVKTGEKPKKMAPRVEKKIEENCKRITENLNVATLDLKNVADKSVNFLTTEIVSPINENSANLMKNEAFFDVENSERQLHKSPRKSKGRAPPPPHALQADSTGNNAEILDSDLEPNRTRKTASMDDLTKITQQNQPIVLERAQSLDINEQILPNLKRKSENDEILTVLSQKTPRLEQNSLKKWSNFGNFDLNTRQEKENKFFEPNNEILDVKNLNFSKNNSERLIFEPKKQLFASQNESNFNFEHNILNESNTIFSKSKAVFEPQNNVEDTSFKVQVHKVPSLKSKIIKSDSISEVESTEVIEAPFIKVSTNTHSEKECMGCTMHNSSNVLFKTSQTRNSNIDLAEIDSQIVPPESENGGINLKKQSLVLKPDTDNRHVTVDIKHFGNEPVIDHFEDPNVIQVDSVGSNNVSSLTITTNLESNLQNKVELKSFKVNPNENTSHLTSQVPVEPSREKAVTLKPTKLSEMTFHISKLTTISPEQVTIESLETKDQPSFVEPGADETTETSSDIQHLITTSMGSLAEERSSMTIEVPDVSQMTSDDLNITSKVTLELSHSAQPAKVTIDTPAERARNGTTRKSFEATSQQDMAGSNKIPESGNDEIRSVFKPEVLIKPTFLTFKPRIETDKSAAKGENVGKSSQNFIFAERYSSLERPRSDVLKRLRQERVGGAQPEVLTIDTESREIRTMQQSPRSRIPVLSKEAAARNVSVTAIKTRKGLDNVSNVLVDSDN